MLYYFPKSGIITERWRQNSSVYPASVYRSPLSFQPPFSWILCINPLVCTKFLLILLQIPPKFSHFTVPLFTHHDSRDFFLPMYFNYSIWNSSRASSKKPSQLNSQIFCFFGNSYLLFSLLLNCKLIKHHLVIVYLYLPKTICLSL